MARIILIRHGETDWNREKRLQGHIDIPLNEAGRRQAEQLGMALAGESFVAVYASDLQRAIATAEAVAYHHGVSVQTDTRLRERTYGIVEGLTHSEIASLHPRSYAAWQNREIDFSPEGGESLRTFHARITAAVDDIAARHLGQSIALVAHGGVLDCLYRAATGTSLDAPRQHDMLNASINRLRWHGNTLSLVDWGDVAHLHDRSLDETDRT